MKGRFFLRIFAAMWKRLRDKWKVNEWQLLIILLTFAIGGSLTGWMGKKLMALLPVEQTALYLIIYIIVVTIIWPMAVLLVSIPFGQYVFFKSYLKKMFNRITGKSSPQPIEKAAETKKIAVFASGAGSNAQKIIEKLNSDPGSKGKVVLVVCNNPGAGVLEIAKNKEVATLVIEKERFFKGDGYLPELSDAGIDFIVLAGFLWKIPAVLVQAYTQKMVNIHPALLPKYGGKGMYGRHVHEAVLANGESESGITIHWVDEQFDHGATIFQALCPVLPGDSPETLANRIHELEHRHYPEQVAHLIQE